MHISYFYVLIKVHLPLALPSPFGVAVFIFFLLLFLYKFSGVGAIAPTQENKPLLTPGINKKKATALHTTGTERELLFYPPPSGRSRGLIKKNNKPSHSGGISKKNSITLFYKDKI